MNDLNRNTSSRCSGVVVESLCHTMKNPSLHRLTEAQPIRRCKCKTRFRILRVCLENRRQVRDLLKRHHKRAHTGRGIPSCDTAASGTTGCAGSGATAGPGSPATSTTWQLLNRNTTCCATAAPTSSGGRMTPPGI